MRQSIYPIRVLTKAFLAAVLGAIGVLVAAISFAEEPVAAHAESTSFGQYSPRAFIGEDPSIVSFDPLWAGKDEPIFNDDWDETVLERWTENGCLYKRFSRFQFKVGSGIFTTWNLQPGTF